MPGPVYAADPEGAVRALELDGLTALFHRPSGATHIVAPPAPEILAALRDGPADADVLLDRMRARYDLADGDRSALHARLAELEEAGLVRRS